ncbi:MAG: GNAT family N-acetyltransferase [Phycisphaerales bacterium]|nr:GNAT family N-acetyltransferase [Phycisphaerales bacterium]
MPYLDSELRPANDAQRWAALRLAITDGRTTDPERDHHVKAFMDYARAMNWPLDRIWRCDNGSRLAWSCAALKSPGRSSMLMAPYPTTLSADQIATYLRLILRDEAESGVQLVQSLLFTEDLVNRAALESVGFHEIAVLYYLERLGGAPAGSAAEFSAPAGLDAPNWIHYSPEHHAIFEDLIGGTYIDSLDCPGLAALRKVKDVVEGHKGAGRFDPKKWFLLRNNDTPVACILFGESPLRPSAELVYMGVHPAYRRRGVGGRVLAFGLESMRQFGIRTITLAVDARNLPALKTYESAGFRRTHIRRAMVRSLANNA